MAIQPVSQKSQLYAVAQVGLHEPRPCPLPLSITAPWLKKQTNLHSYVNSKEPKNHGVYESISEYYRRTVADNRHMHRPLVGLPTATDLTVDLIDRSQQRTNNHFRVRQSRDTEEQRGHTRLQIQSLKSEGTWEPPISTRMFSENKQARKADDVLAIGQTSNHQSVSNVEAQGTSQGLHLWQWVTLSLVSLLNSH